MSASGTATSSGSAIHAARLCALRACAASNAKHGSQEVGAAVAQIDAGGRAVEHEETDERATDRERGSAAVAADHREANGGDRDDRRCESVHTVDQIDRVHEHDDDRGRTEQSEAPRCGLDDAGKDPDRDLHEQPRHGRDGADVVGDPERDRQTERHEPQRLLYRDHDADRCEDRDAAEIRDRLALHLERSGMVEDAERERDPARDRRQRERKDEGGGEGYEEAHTNTSERTLSCSENCCSGAKPQRS